jgi:RNA polymerase sigma factor (sigma-70 family)
VPLRTAFDRLRQVAPSRWRRARAEAVPGSAVMKTTCWSSSGTASTSQLTREDARTWLYGIATNLIRRHRRDEVRLLSALERTGLDPVTEPFTEQIDTRVSADAASRRLAAAVAALPAAHRDVLQLVTWANLNYDQAGEALGVPAGTVRSRMNRVSAKLRTALGDIDPMAVGLEHRRAALSDRSGGTATAG